MYFSTPACYVRRERKLKRNIFTFVLLRKTTEKAFRVTKTVTDFNSNIFTVVLSSVYEF